MQLRAEFGLIIHDALSHGFGGLQREGHIRPDACQQGIELLFGDFDGQPGHGNGRVVLASRFVSLKKRRQQISGVNIAADGARLDIGQRQESVLGIAHRRQGRDQRGAGARQS